MVVVKTSQQSDSTRQIIMDAASELFAAEGYGSVSMRKIAAKIGYTPTTIYLYFEDKADLLNQICERTFANLTRNLTAIAKLSVKPLERLRLGLLEYVQFGLKHPNHYSILFISPMSSSPGQAFENSQGEAAFNTLRDSVAACKADGSIRKPDDVEVISQTLWAGIHGVTSLLITQQGFPFVEQAKLIDNVLDTLIAGVSV